MNHPIVEQILAGSAPPNIKQAAARGALPIPREDMLELWACLRNDPDPGVKMTARENLASVRMEEWLEVLPGNPFRPEFFDFAVKVLAKDARAAAAMMRNRSLPNQAVEELARVAAPQLLDLIIDGQTRLIACPAIVVALLNNSQLNATQGRKIYDLAEQFLRNDPVIIRLVEEKLGLKVSITEAPETKRAEIKKEIEKKEAAPAPAIPEPEKEPAEEPSAEAPREEAAAPGEIPLDELPEEAFKEVMQKDELDSLFKKILTMSVPHKIELALKGNKEARGLLIRDSNKLIQLAVVSSPKITEQEIEGIAKLRNLPEEILRKISTMGEFMKKYPIMKALATNPKTPLAVAIPLVSKFNDMDMKFLLKDKGVSETLRREAKKIWELKNTKKVVSFKKH